MHIHYIKVPAATFQKLVDCFPDRVAAVIAAKSESVFSKFDIQFTYPMIYDKNDNLLRIPYHSATFKD